MDGDENGAGATGGSNRNPKRGHGGDNRGIENAPIVEPAELAGSGGTGSDGTPKRRGGWPKGKPRGKGNGGSQAAKATANLDLSGLESILFSLHMLLAANSGHEELALSEEEAHALAEAFAKVQRHYPPKVNQKMMDWGNLALCLGTVYGSRGVTLYQKTKDAKEAKRRAPPLRVVEMPQHSPMPQGGGFDPRSQKLPD